MTRHPLLAAVALAGGLTLASAVPAAADPGSVCLATTDDWCSPTVSDVLHGNPSTDLPGAICVYPYDGGWCSPDLDEHVTELCVYPYDGGWCIPWVELPPV